MVIGIDASRANHEQKTGVEWYAWHVIQNLKKIIPLDTEVILYSDVVLVGELAKLPPNWESRVLGWPPKRLWTQIRLSWEMLINPPDVLFIPASVPPLIHPKRTVMTVHDVAAVRFPSSYNWFERWYSVWSAKWAVRKLWRVIVPSEFVKKELLEGTSIKEPVCRTGRQKASVCVVSHGYDNRYKKINDEKKIDEVLKKYGITKPFILSVGRLEEKKNTVRLIQAFDLICAKLRPTTDNLFLVPCSLQLILVGQPGHGYEQVKQVLAASPNKNRILPTGWVDPEDMVYIMNAAEVFIFPSLSEGFGLPVLEAFACGTPVVTSRGTSLEEVGGDGCVYVDPLDVGSIARGLAEVLGDEKLRDDKIERGIEIAKNYSWDKCAEQTMRVLLN